MYDSSLRLYSVVLSFAAVLSISTVSGASAQETPAPPSASTRLEIRRVTVSPTRGLKNAEVAAAAGRAAIGSRGDSDTISKAAEAVVALYRSRGFPAARVIDSDVTPDGTLRLTVAEGTIGRILIIGNKRTRSSTILKALSTRPGDLYREKTIRQDRNRLSLLGIFSEVSLAARVRNDDILDADLPPVLAEDTTKKSPEKSSSDPTTDKGAEKTSETVQDEAAQEPEKGEKEKPPAPPYIVESETPVTDDLGVVDLVVKVKERPTVNLAATLGYTDGTGALGYVDASEVNLAGTAQRVFVQWQRSAQTTIDRNGNLRSGNARSAFSLAYEMPTLGPQSISYGVELYDKNTVFLPFFSGGQETLRSYEQRRGGRARIGRQIGSLFTAFALLRHDQVGFGEVPDRLNPPRDELIASNGTVGAIGLQLVADGRDVTDNPRGGFLHSLIIENADRFLGGNRKFQQARLDLRQYTGVGFAKEGTVLALRVLGGTSRGDLPLSEQFYLGGYELLRGYDLFSVRGDRMLLGTAEVRVPIGQGLQGVVFTDIGNAWRPGEKFGATELKAGVGAGIRFLSPIGPIRLDAAYGSRLQTYVSLGQSF